MEKIYDKCCGIDVHKKLIVACLRSGRKNEIREFGTSTKEILSLTDWLTDKGCEMIAMESTGSYWKPIYNIIEELRLAGDHSQCSTHEGRTREEDGCQGCGVDSRLAATWVAESELYTG